MVYTKNVIIHSTNTSNTKKKHTKKEHTKKKHTEEEADARTNVIIHSKTIGRNHENT